MSMDSSDSETKAPTRQANVDIFEDRNDHRSDANDRDVMFALFSKFSGCCDSCRRFIFKTPSSERLGESAVFVAAMIGILCAAAAPVWFH